MNKDTIAKDFSLSGFQVVLNKKADDYLTRMPVWI